MRGRKTSRRRSKERGERAGGRKGEISSREDALVKWRMQLAVPQDVAPASVHCVNRGGGGDVPRPPRRAINLPACHLRESAREAAALRFLASYFGSLFPANVVVVVYCIMPGIVESLSPVSPFNACCFNLPSTQLPSFPSSPASSTAAPYYALNFRFSFSIAII